MLINKAISTVICSEFKLKFLISIYDPRSVNGFASIFCLVFVVFFLFGWFNCQGLNPLSLTTSVLLKLDFEINFIEKQRRIFRAISINQKNQRVRWKTSFKSVHGNCSKIDFNKFTWINDFSYQTKDPA